MNYQLIPKELRPIAEKVEAQQRISEAEALTLYGTNDLNALGMIANLVRERKNGNYATYIHNRYINYSNICILSCQFCAFAARKRDAHAFEYAIEEIVQAVTDALPLGVTEVHMVGGLHPTLKKDWYLDLLGRLRALDPQLHIKAFTAIEIRHLAQRVFKMPICDTLEILREYGRQVSGVFHCFGGTLEQANEVLDLGHLVSFTGIVTFKNGKQVREVAAKVPLAGFMVETDCPYLAPVPFRGKRCEPAYTRLVAEEIARARGVSLEEIAGATTATAQEFFRFDRG